MSSITQLYLDSQSSGSMPTMASALNKVAKAVGVESRESIPWVTLTYEDVVHIRQWVSEQGNDGRPMSAAGTNKILAALRGGLKIAWRTGLIDQATYAILTSIEPVGHNDDDDPTGRELSSDEISAMLATCDNSAGGIRDKSIISLMASTGVRRGEVCGLNAEDVNLTAGTVRVLGKGQKRRTVDLVGGGLDTMRAWLDIRGNEAGPLFTQVRRGGHIQAGTRLSEVGLSGIFDERAELAGVMDCTPHDMRRTVASKLLDNADIVTVQRILGHSSPTVTAKYDRRPLQRRRDALTRIAL